MSDEPLVITGTWPNDWSDQEKVDYLQRTVQRERASRDRWKATALGQRGELDELEERIAQLQELAEGRGAEILRLADEIEAAPLADLASTVKLIKDQGEQIISLQRDNTELRLAYRRAFGEPVGI